MAELKVQVNPRQLSLVMQKFHNIKHVLLSSRVVGAMMTWSKMVQKAAQKFVPVKSGALRDDINYYLLNRTAKVITTKVTTKPRTSEGRDYAFYLEFGTQPHWVGPVHAAALHWKDPNSGVSRFSKGHRVSGIHARRFMLRAYLSTRKQGEKLLAIAVRAAMGKGGRR